MFRKLIYNESIYTSAAALLLSIGLLLLLGNREWWPPFYSPRFFGSAFILSSLVIWISKSVFRSEDGCRMNSAYFLRFVIMLSLIINAAGELYFYQLYRFGFQFDKFAHLANSLLFILALASYGRTRYGLVPMKSLKISVVIVIICGLGWEVGEFASDKFFQTKEFGIYGQLKAIDTIFDIIYDFLGITLAAIMEKSFRFRLRSEVALCEGSPPA